MGLHGSILENSHTHYILVHSKLVIFKKRRALSSVNAEEMVYCHDVNFTITCSWTAKFMREELRDLFSLRRDIATL